MHGAHNYARLYYHFVTHAKYRLPLIAGPARTVILDVAEDKAEKYACKLLSANGSKTHLHFFVRAMPTFDMCGFLGELKGGSSFAINKAGLLSHKFSWQPGYAVFSISYGHVDKVKGYIYKQERHHRVGERLESRFSKDDLRPWAGHDPVKLYHEDGIFMDDLKSPHSTSHSPSQAKGLINPFS